MASTEGPSVTAGQPNLRQQDLSKLDVAKLTALSPEVISRQATINIGTIGHVAHGKSTVVKAVSGVQTVRFKNELERNITIKLGLETNLSESKRRLSESGGFLQKPMKTTRRSSVMGALMSLEDGNSALKDVQRIKYNDTKKELQTGSDISNEESLHSGKGSVKPIVQCIDKENSSPSVKKEINSTEDSVSHKEVNGLEQDSALVNDSVGNDENQTLMTNGINANQSCESQDADNIVLNGEKSDDTELSQPSTSKLIPRVKKRRSGDPFCVTKKRKKKLRKESAQNSNTEDTYEVERIISHHEFENDKIRYWVKWKGWPEEYNTWEPVENLTNCKKLLDKYMSSVRKGSKLSDNSFSEDIHILKQKLIKPSKEDLEKLFLQFSSNKGVKYEAPNGEVIDEKVKKLYSTPENTWDPVFVEEVKKDIVLQVFHLCRSQQLMKLKDWEIEMNFLAFEKAQIIVENNVDLEGPPSNFIYINDYMPGEGIIIPDDPPVCCDCSVCDKTSKNCCGLQFDTPFAYTSSKILLAKPGTPIYECNKRCKCNVSCINRVVQCGRAVDLCIFRTSNGCGWGVKAVKEIKRGQFVCEYVGEVISRKEADKRGKEYDAAGKTYLFDLDFNDDEEFPYTVDAAAYGNISHFINHSCSPNLAVFAVYINCLDPNLPKLALFATKNIHSGEELTFNYMYQANYMDNGVSRNRSHLNKGSNEQNTKIPCKCNSTNCKKYLF